MIRFQDTVEKKDDSELLSSTGFLEIKPNGSLSNEEALSFIDGLFSVDPDSQDFHDEESLLAEIFGRYEEEFEFDFELDDEIQYALERFNLERWENLSESEKVDAIYELASIIGDRLGLDDKLVIQFYDGRDGFCGAYLPGANVIEINRNTLADPREVVDTVVHEARHAYQHKRAVLQETEQDILYRINFENYISPIPLADGKYLFFTDYQDQLVEAEARAFANIFRDKEVA